MSLREFLFGKKEQEVDVPAEPAHENAWLSSNFTFRWVTRLKNWGITDKEYSKERHHKKTDDEAIFSLYKKLLVQHKNDMLVQQALYYELAMIDAELGRDPKPNLVLAQKNLLAHYHHSKNIRSVVIESNKDACASCKKLDGWVLTFSEVTKQHPLPNLKCMKKHGKKSFCRCIYGPMARIE